MIIWGQIDLLMSMVIAHLQNTPFGSAQMLMENMTTGPKLSLFKRTVKKCCADSEILNLESDFYKSMTKLLDKRNCLIHGLWTYYGSGSDGADYTPAMMYSKMDAGDVKVSDLGPMILSAAKNSMTIAEIGRRTGANPFWNEASAPAIFLMGTGPGPVPPPEIPAPAD
jgi:hypothetical protein